MIYKVDGTPTLNQIAGSPWGKLGVDLCYLASHSGPSSMAPSQSDTLVHSDPQQPSTNPRYHVRLLSLDRFGEPLRVLPVFTASVCDLCPHGRGTVYIRSFDPGEIPSIQPSYPNGPRDLKVAADAICLTRYIIAASTLAALHPQEYKLGPEYRSGEDLQRAATEVGTIILHPAGTYHMGQELRTVVDAQLRVHGIPGLRIVDASTMPSLTSGNTCSLILMIAEKAVQMILVEHYHEAASQVVESVMAIGGKEAAEA